MASNFVKYKYPIAFLTSIFLIGFSAMVHYQTYNPQDWGAFSMWATGLFFVPFIISLGVRD